MAEDTQIDLNVDNQEDLDNQEVDNSGVENDDVTQIEDQPKYTEQEQLAMAKGWRPKDQYNGDIKDWRSAELFLALDPFYKENHALRNQIKQFEKVVNDLSLHNEKVKQAAFDEAVQQLKQQKALALRNGDDEAFLKAETQEDQIKKQWAEQQKEPTKDTKAATSPYFQDFINNNTWYVMDETKRAYADKVGFEYAQRFGIDVPSASPEEQKALLSFVANEVKNKFDVSNKPRVSSVEAGGSSSVQARKKGFSEADLTEVEKTAMKRFVQAGALTKEDYIKQIEMLAKQGRR